MRIFRVYELFLQKAIPAIASLPPSTPGCLAGKAGLFMNHGTLPLSTKLLDMQCFRSLTHDGKLMFVDRRSEILIKRYEEYETDTIRLTGGIAPHGQYMASALCSFAIEPEADTDRDEGGGRKGGESDFDDDSEGVHVGHGGSERLPSLTLINGYIRIVGVVSPDSVLEMELHRGVTGITTLSFEPPDESDAYDSDWDTDA